MTRKEILEKTIDFDDAINRIVRLEEENAELKDDNKVMADNYSKMEQKFYDNLTKAKELLKQFLNAKNSEDTYKAEFETEQFLKDCDIDNAIQQANKGLDFDKIADEMEQDLKDSKEK